MDQYSTQDDSSLAARAQQGDLAAFEELVVRYKEKVLKMAFRFTRSESDMEDVAQDIFLQAWKKLSQFRAKAPFEHWLMRLSANQCRSHYRKMRRQLPTIPLEHEVVAAPPDEEKSFRLHEFQRALAHLNDKERLVITLFELDGLSAKEVAEALGWSVGNVKVRAHRARKKLSAYLTNDSQ
ncbi:MAG: RNA polymerase sigma factor [Verrucomicrobiales bacterium]